MAPTRKHENSLKWMVLPVGAGTLSHVCVHTHAYTPAAQFLMATSASPAGRFWP